MARSNHVRVIGGSLRGRRIGFAEGKGLRPTADRLRETLFNWLQLDIVGSRCLDLFAGSGALGIEAISRGAADVVFVERSEKVARALRRNLEQFDLADKGRLLTSDARTFLRRPMEYQFDLVFLDPPFASDLLQHASDMLAAPGWIAAEGLVYQEQDVSTEWPELPSGWHELRNARAGQAKCRLLRVVDN